MPDLGGANILFGEHSGSGGRARVVLLAQSPVSRFLCGHRALSAGDSGPGSAVAISGLLFVIGTFISNARANARRESVPENPITGRRPRARGGTSLSMSRRS